MSIVTAIEMKGLQFLVQLISGDFMETKKKVPPNSATAKNSHGRGYTTYSFIDRIAGPNNKICRSDDDLLTDLNETKTYVGRKKFEDRDNWRTKKLQFE